MNADVQPSVLMMPQRQEQVRYFEYRSKSDADVKAAEIGGVIIKEQGVELYRVFDTTPPRNMGWREDDPWN